jgi:hypothetical protein
MFDQVEVYVLDGVEALQEPSGLILVRFDDEASMEREPT